MRKKKTWSNIRRGLFAICIPFGILIVIGTAGASDLELIELKDLIIRGSIGLILTLIGFIGLNVGGFNND